MNKYSIENYEEEIEKAAKEIINKKDLNLLKSILKNYDDLVKNVSSNVSWLENVPFWNHLCSLGGKNVG